ncbi:transmembrane protein 119 [Anguilla anguilla]|uniref:transmembrane protein 119 n=1 Tax=Anguilla anguilla TaxID=7936 RepID=UPI0015A8BE5A|nr:transmembrane protein 119 [Anguilla anguilla]
MTTSAVLRVAYVSAFLVWSRGCQATPFPFNITAEGSGDGEPELLFPTAYATRLPGPAAASPTPRVTTAVRIKNFILNEVVDFLRDNLLLIVVVSSLLIVVVFIVCCASAMSHKRKLKAYYPASFPAKKYVDQKDKKGGSRTFSEVPGKGHDCQKAEPADSSGQQQADAAAANKNLRTPSKALVGERGKDPKPKASETQKAPQEKPKADEPAAKPEEEEEKRKDAKESPAPSQPLVCTCHLRNTNPPKEDKDKDK